MFVLGDVVFLFMLVIDGDLIICDLIDVIFDGEGFWCDMIIGIICEEYGFFVFGNLLFDNFIEE